MSDAGAFRSIHKAEDVARVAKAILECIQQELATFPHSPTHGLVALNALAFVAAAILAATDFDPGAIEFFEKALEDCMREHENAGGG